jgi:hypothetical protein
LLFSAALFAQSEPLRQATVEGSDIAASTSVSHSWYRILPAATAAARKLPPTSLSNKTFTAVPSAPSPSFYPADLTYHGGHVVPTAEHHLVYFDCPSGPAVCWGNPATFLKNLNDGAFIHLSDQYVGTTASYRYPVGSAISVNETLQTNVLGQNDLLAIIHSAAVNLSVQGGYKDIIHLFLPQGVDTCFDLTSICYSPDYPPSFAFCAYHGSVVFSDIGHIMFTIEPYQNVPGCQVAAPSPNGQLADSTASVLSHETFETITDPDGSAWWSNASLVELGAEIGDICEPMGNAMAQFMDPVFVVNGKNYKIQLEYSNTYHACTH